MGNIFGCLDPKSQQRFSGVSQNCRKMAFGQYTEQLQQEPDLLDAYAHSQSQSQDAAVLPKTEEEIKRKAASLVQKIRCLVGGAPFLERISNEASLFHSASQKRCVKGLYNCKTIGLIPFLKAIPAAQECLQQLGTFPTNQKKFNSLVEWIRTHRDEVAALRELTVVDCVKNDVKTHVLPTFYTIPGKVYNLVPGSIRYFKGLEKISFYNNLLSSLPPQIRGLTNLKVLNIGKNYFQKMPPVIPSLHSLSLLENEYPLAFEDVASFIQEYIRQGGEDLQIHLNKENLADPRYQSFIKEIGLQNTHTLKFEGETTLFLKKNPWRTEERKGIPLFPID